MNNSEFRVIGEFLYGNSWKKELTKGLKFSEASRTVDKIAADDRNVSENTQLRLIELLKFKGEMINTILTQIENPEKILVKQTDMALLRFDVDGVTCVNVFEEHSALTNMGIMIKNADLSEIPYQYEYQSLLIADAAQQAVKHDDRQILVDAINKYFDLSFFNESDWLMD